MSLPRTRRPARVRARDSIPRHPPPAPACRRSSSLEESRRFDACDTLDRQRSSPGRELVLQTLLVLLYLTGLRAGEGLCLTLTDVDLEKLRCAASIQPPVLQDGIGPTKTRGPTSKYPEHMTATAATEVTDEQLVALAAGGDTGAFNQLVVRWERPIFALAYRTLGREEDARDVCQEAFLRAFRAIGGFKGQARFSSWLYRIALNQCRDWIRKERRVRVVPASDDLQAEQAHALEPAEESVEELIVAA